MRQNQSTSGIRILALFQQLFPQPVAATLPKNQRETSAKPARNQREMSAK
jgi:hypothetical protein